MSISDGSTFGTKQELINAFKNNTSNQWIMEFYMNDIIYTWQRNLDFNVRFNRTEYYSIPKRLTLNLTYYPPYNENLPMYLYDEINNIGKARYNPSYQCLYKQLSDEVNVDSTTGHKWCNNIYYGQDELQTALRNGTAEIGFVIQTPNIQNELNNGINEVINNYNSTHKETNDRTTRIIMLNQQILFKWEAIPFIMTEEMNEAINYLQQIDYKFINVFSESDIRIKKQKYLELLNIIDKKFIVLLKEILRFFKNIKKNLNGQYDTIYIDTVNLTNLFGSNGPFRPQERYNYESENPPYTPWLLQIDQYIRDSLKRYSGDIYDLDWDTSIYTNWGQITHQYLKGNITSTNPDGNDLAWINNIYTKYNEFLQWKDSHNIEILNVNLNNGSIEYKGVEDLKISIQEWYNFHSTIYPDTIMSSEISIINNKFIYKIFMDKYTIQQYDPTGGFNLESLLPENDYIIYNVFYKFIQKYYTESNTHYYFTNVVYMIQPKLNINTGEISYNEMEEYQQFMSMLQSERNKLERTNSVKMGSDNKPMPTLILMFIQTERGTFFEVLPVEPKNSDFKNVPHLGFFISRCMEMSDISTTPKEKKIYSLNKKLRFIQEQEEKKDEIGIAPMWNDKCIVNIFPMIYNQEPLDWRNDNYYSNLIYMINSDNVSINFTDEIIDCLYGYGYRDVTSDQGIQPWIYPISNGDYLIEPNMIGYYILEGPLETN